MQYVQLPRPLQFPTYVTKEAQLAPPVQRCHRLIKQGRAVLHHILRSLTRSSWRSEHERGLRCKESELSEPKLVDGGWAGRL